MSNAKALKWSFVGQISYFFIYFIFNIILSRILLPADFGLFAIIATFIIFFSLIKDFGLGSYLITRKEVTKELCDLIFYFNLIFSLFLFVLIFLISPAIANFYNDSRLTILIRINALAFLIDAICIIPNTMLVREMDFYRLFIVKISAAAIAGIVAILLAFYGWGIYSLIYQAVLFSLCTCLILFAFRPYKPGKSIQWNKLREVVKFSLPLFLSQFVQYFSRNIDNLIIGRVFGASSLGFYNRAYTIMQMPLQNISTAVTGVLFPLLSKSADDLERTSVIYRKAILGIAYISFPIMAYTFVYSSEIIIFLFGNKWIEVSRLLKIFCIVGMLETIITPVGTLLLSFGKTIQLFKFSTALRVLIIAMIVFGSYFSVKAIAICYMIATIIITPYAIFYAAKEIGKSFIYLAAPLLKVFSVTLLSAGLIYLTKIYLLNFNLILLLGISGILFLCLYLVFSYVAIKSIMSDCISIIVKRKL
ncbi:MAG: lipopolysaccharide biosynthesis protein [Chitinophagaceae bacterium]|nr:lipopolysaccharide biosynthesis protein [Chitinophagaceae bacterium]MBP7109666.1 lipopolysaccharide biosynthesis protein [Chitinophagaceae bacterium]MBP7279128.1 lipopolysaccharide biosynthesis protein [Sedimentibacter sp.]